MKLPTHSLTHSITPLCNFGDVSRLPAQSCTWHSPEHWSRVQTTQRTTGFSGHERQIQLAHRSAPALRHPAPLSAPLVFFRLPLTGPRRLSDFLPLLRPVSRSAPMLWRSLPACLRQTDIGYEQFKRWLKTFVRALRSRRIATNLLNLRLSKFSYLLAFFGVIDHMTTRLAICGLL